MQITRTYQWNRRDFLFDSKCEHCGHELKNQEGYDDSYFYNTVMREQKCEKCGESSDSKDSGLPKAVIIPRHNPNILM